ncbi:MAG TPA: MFS transporter [Archangium sp.]|nr:MFS transporter [Archangium sp.]
MATVTRPEAPRAGLLAQLAATGRPVKLLLACDLGFNLGFYMLVPFLAGHLAALAVSGWLTGLILGLRNLSQQGLYLVGGALADRGEYRSLIVTGCVVRCGAFALFGLSEHPAVLAGASVLTGVAAALFTPAMKAYLSTLSREDRPAAFALSSVLSQAGALLGPLIGLTVLGSDFRLLSLTSAGLFLLWAVVLHHLLPPQRGSETASAGPVWAEWRQVLASRRFLAFAVAMAGYAVLFNQLYLALPLVLGRAWPGQRGVGLVFILSGLMAVALQVRVTALCTARASPATSLVTGLGLMGLAFCPLAALALLGREEPALLLAAALTTTAVLTLGMMIAHPFAMNMIPVLAEERRVGTYYGFFYLAAGVGAALGNLGIGHLLELDGPRLGAAPWLVLMAVGLGSASALAVLRARGALPAAAPSSVTGGGR